MRKEGGVIGITGRAMSGKDTFADILEETLLKRGYEVKRIAMADPMKEMLIDTFGFSKEQMYDQDLKKTKDAFWDITPRWLLQQVGTEMFRKLWRDDVWTLVMYRKIKEFLTVPGRVVIIPDIRYENEAEMVREKCDGVVLRVLRDEIEEKYERVVTKHKIRLVLRNMYGENSLLFKTVSKFLPKVEPEEAIYLHSSETSIDLVNCNDVVYNSQPSREAFQHMCVGWVEEFFPSEIYTYWRADTIMHDKK